MVESTDLSDSQERARFYAEQVKWMLIDTKRSVIEQVQLGEFLHSYPNCKTFAIRLAPQRDNLVDFTFHLDQRNNGYSCDMILLRTRPEGLEALQRSLLISQGKDTIPLTRLESDSTTLQDATMVRKVMNPGNLPKHCHFGLDPSRLNTIELPLVSFSAKELLELVALAPQVSVLSCRIVGDWKDGGEHGDENYDIEALAMAAPRLSKLRLAASAHLQWSISLSSTLEDFEEHCPDLTDLSVPWDVYGCSDGDSDGDSDCDYEDFDIFDFATHKVFHPQFKKINLWILPVSIDEPAVTPWELSVYLARLFPPDCLYTAEVWDDRHTEQSNLAKMYAAEITKARESIVGLRKRLMDLKAKDVLDNIDELLMGMPSKSIARVSHVPGWSQVTNRAAA